MVNEADYSVHTRSPQLGCVQAKHENRQQTANNAKSISLLVLKSINIDKMEHKYEY